MIAAAMQALVDRLQAAGVRACLDKADLAPPAVLVMPPSLTYTFAGTADATWTLVAAVPDTGTGSAIVTLSDYVDQVRAALDDELITAIPAVVTMTEGPPVPAYRLEYTSEIGG